MFAVLAPEPARKVRLVARHRRHNQPVFLEGDVSPIAGDRNEDARESNSPYHPHESGGRSRTRHEGIPLATIRSSRNLRRGRAARASSGVRATMKKRNSALGKS